MRCWVCCSATVGNSWGAVVLDRNREREAGSLRGRCGGGCSTAGGVVEDEFTGATDGTIAGADDGRSSTGLSGKSAESKRPVYKGKDH
ncbi:hypothetical protein MLD38_012928 [Melastoma candidum]|uniref:Uncharacterized protein n=1 Tax=Melastoma candidum TaxID=119954 RepID=A0ACB9RBK0_9MYRT|nr:hypothetical protein MLD38_012928 [Melastoma candidum]